MDTARTTANACPAHAPAGITAEPNDDGRPTCAVCGVSNYAVKPYRVAVAVVERGYWRTVDGSAVTLRS